MTHLKNCKEVSVTKYGDGSGDGCIKRDPSSTETGSRKQPFWAQMHTLDFGFDLERDRKLSKSFRQWR